MSESISTTALSRELDVEASDLFQALQRLNWISRASDRWELTKEGAAKGGTIKNDPNFGPYILWPKDLPLDKIKAQLANNLNHLVTASAIGEKLGISANKVNLLLSELGWIEKDEKRGWYITKLGKMAGGKQKEHEDSGRLYVVWPDTITDNSAFRESLIESQVIEAGPEKSRASTGTVSDFRSAYPANHLTADGHLVRSRAEVIIDNFLYHNQIIHAYERKVPIEEDLFCDFYIPMGKKVYIEFWGLENDPQYVERKKKKIQIYRKHELNLVELTDQDITKLDDTFPGKLLKFDIKGMG